MEITEKHAKNGERRTEWELLHLLCRAFLIPPAAFLVAFRAGDITSCSCIVVVCELCDAEVETTLKKIARQIRNLGPAEGGTPSRRAHCPNCSPNAQSEAAILQVIERTRGITIAKRTFPIRIKRADYPKYFESLQGDEVRLQIDGVELGGAYNYEIQSDYHATPNNYFDSERRQSADGIKRNEHDSQCLGKTLIEIVTSDSATIAENLRSAKQELLDKGVPIDPAEWDKQADAVVILSQYRTDVIAAVTASGATWASTIPGTISQTTVLDLFCENGSTWRPHATQLVRGQPSSCSCEKCANRRPTSRADVVAQAERLGYEVQGTDLEFSAKGRITLICSTCNTLNSINVRTFRSWVAQDSADGGSCTGVSRCQYCMVEGLIEEYSTLKQQPKLIQIAKGFAEISEKLTFYKKRYLRDELPLELRALLRARIADIGGVRAKVRRSETDKLVLILEASKNGDAINTNHPIIGEFVRYFLRQFRVGELSLAMEEKVRAAGVPIDSTPNRSSADRLAELGEYIRKHGEMPTPTTNTALNQWVRDTRHAVKLKAHTPEFREAWDAVTRDVPNGKRIRTRRDFKPFSEARRIVRSKGYRSAKEFHAALDVDPDLSGIRRAPEKRRRGGYRDFTNWPDFLGKSSN